MTETLSTARTTCTLDQLQVLINPALDSPDLAALLAHLPNPADDNTDAESQSDSGQS